MKQRQDQHAAPYQPELMLDSQSDQSLWQQSGRRAVLIEGVAGSGKSTLLAKQLWLHRQEAGRSLLLTFSRAGIEVLTQYAQALGLRLDNQLSASTIDALAYEALVQLGDERTVLSDTQVIRYILPDLVRQTCEALNQRGLGGEFYAPSQNEHDMRLVLDDLDFFRASLAYRADSVEEQLEICQDRLNFDRRFVAYCFECYEQLRWRWHDRHWYKATSGHSQEGFRRISEAVSDLYHYEDLGQCEVLRDYRFIYIDEFHDISPLQLDFIQRLAPPSGDHLLMAVGDRAQRIFGWRGADTTFVFEQFKRNYKAAVYPLQLSHRFDQQVAALATRISGQTVKAREGAKVTLSHVAANEVPSNFDKPRQHLALITQNQQQRMVAAWQLWWHSQGHVKINVNLCDLYVVSLVNILYVLVFDHLPHNRPAHPSGSTPEQANLQQIKATPMSQRVAKTAFAQDIRRFYLGDYCLLSPAAKAEVIAAPSAHAFRQYLLLQLNHKQSLGAASSEKAQPAFRPAMQQALLAAMKATPDTALAPWLETFAEQAQLFRTITAGGISAAYHHHAWRILLRLLQSLQLSLSDWPPFYQSLYASAATGRSSRGVLQCLTVAQAKGREFDQVVIFNADEHGFKGQDRSQSARNEFYVALTRVKKHLQFWDSYF